MGKTRMPALASSDWTDAATYFRRAVVLTNGSFAPSLGLSEALLGLDRSRAMRVGRSEQASGVRLGEEVGLVVLGCDQDADLCGHRDLLVAGSRSLFAMTPSWARTTPAPSSDLGIFGPSDPLFP